MPDGGPRSGSPGGKPAIPHRYGIYVLGFMQPCPAAYAGIAAGGGSAPDGIVGRLGKHRVKAPGAHVADRPGMDGMHHPGEWSRFARDRHFQMAGAGEPDVLEDVVAMTGTIRDGVNTKPACTYYEG